MPQLYQTPLPVYVNSVEGYPFTGLWFGALPTTDGHLEFLRDCLNVGLIVNLTVGKLGQWWRTDETLKDIESFQFPILDFSAPSEDIRPLMRKIDEALTRHSVYIHCYGGIGRSGMIAACYLVWKGVDIVEALTRTALLRPGFPETMEQEDFIRNFARELKEEKRLGGTNL